MRPVNSLLWQDCCYRIESRSSYHVFCGLFTCSSMTSYGHNYCFCTATAAATTWIIAYDLPLRSGHFKSCQREGHLRRHPLSLDFLQQQNLFHDILEMRVDQSYLLSNNVQSIGFDGKFSREGGLKFIRRPNWFDSNITPTWDKFDYLHHNPFSIN